MDAENKMKYTVGTIFRVFQQSATVPHHEFIIVDRERMVNGRTKIHKDMYKIKHILNPQNYSDGWRTEESIKMIENNYWRMEVYQNE